MLTSIHIIVTYKCTFECDHCFLYCHPYSKGTFTIQQIKKALNECKKLGTIRSVGFEGGEAFLFYPLLLESVRIATKKGFKSSIQTNCYWATTPEDAKLWLQPLQDAGLSTLEVSDDTFHHGDNVSNPAKWVVSAAKELGISVNSICIKPPEVKENQEKEKGIPIYLGGPKLRGRAVDKLTQGLPTKHWEQFAECPFEDLRNPGRVHLDPYGNLHLCQGISMGNMWETSLTTLVKNYRPDEHPICGPILKGGPTELAKSHQIPHEMEYIDACHLCSKLCIALLDRFPQYITPRQVYGLE